MDKSLMVFLAVGVGFLYFITNFVGEIQQDDGTIELRNGARLGVLPQEAPSGPESLLEAVLSADVERTRLMAESETATDAHRISEIHLRLADIDAHTAESRAAKN